jgi:mono/diheme cytochrome c family protein
MNTHDTAIIRWGVSARVLVLVLAAVLLVMTGCGRPQEPSATGTTEPGPQPPTEEELAEEPTMPAGAELAIEVIRRMGCGSCHTLKAAGLDLDGQVGPDLTRQAERGRSAEWLRRQLTDPTSIPDGEVVPGFEGMQPVMPSYGRQLSEQELDVVIEFLRSLD